jgi:hypothetical protein
MFIVTYGGKSMDIKDVDHYHAALKASYVLLENGRLKKHSSCHTESITVDGSTLTQVHKVLKSLSTEGLQIPVMECTKTFVNENWFSNPENSLDSSSSTSGTTTCHTPYLLLEHMDINDSDCISPMPCMPENVNCAEDLLPVISNIWGFSSYKGQQAPAITSILNGKDCFINIPTGGGKSLLYMLPAISQPGITIVIEPILALASDQLTRCRQKHMLLQKHMLRSVLSVSHPVIIQETYTKPNLVYIVKYKDNKLCDNIVEEVKGYDCSIVYCSTRCDCENMCAKLCARGVNAKAYHGDMSKSLKEDCFKDGNLVTLSAWFPQKHLGWE